MAYTEPPTKAAGDTFTAAEFNTYLRDNMIDLAARLFPTATAQTGDIDFTTTSTDYVDITDAVVSLTLTRTSTVLLIASGSVKADLDTYGLYLAGSIDGTVDANAIFRDCSSSTSDDSYVPFGYTFWKATVAAGIISVKLQLKTTNGAMTARCQNLNLFAIGIPEV